MESLFSRLVSYLLQPRNKEVTQNTVLHCLCYCLDMQKWPLVTRIVLWSTFPPLLDLVASLQQLHHLCYPDGNTLPVLMKFSIQSR